MEQLLVVALLVALTRCPTPTVLAEDLVTLPPFQPPVFPPVTNPQVSYDAEFIQFKANFSKTYATQDEEAVAKQNFNINWGKCLAHNQDFFKGIVPDFWGSNPDFDKIFSSTQSNLLGNNPSAAELALVNANRRLFSEPVNSLPASVDYIAKSFVTPVKVQGNCASSWAFAATGALESHYAIKTGTLLSFSEKQLLDCSGQSGCNGGTVLNALSYISDNKGIVKGTAYPYKDQDSTCNKTMQTADNLFVKLKGNGYVLIPKGDANALQKAVAEVGPVAVALQAVDSLFYYKGGIYTERNCNPETSNLALLIVGYGIDSKTNLPYWRAKTSWSAKWGDGGYINILRGSNVCGIENFGVYPDLAADQLPPTTTTTTTTTTKAAVTTTKASTTTSLPPVSNNFELLSNSDSELTTDSAVVVFSMISATNQFALKMDRFSTAQAISNDMEQNYGKRWRVVVGTSFSYSGGYATPNYIVLKQKNVSPPVYVTIAQLPDCGIDCTKDLGNATADLNMGTFTVLASDSNADTQLKQVIIRYAELGFLYMKRDTSKLVKYISSKLQNAIGGFMDVVIGSDYDAYYKYRVPKYMRLKQGNLFIDIYSPDCVKPLAPLRSDDISPPKWPKSWWSYDDNPTYFGMCGKNAPLYDGRYPVCNPDDDLLRCCNATGRCGVGPDFCACNGCRDYAANTDLILQDAVAPSRPLQWYTMADNLLTSQPKCGPNAPKLNRTIIPICNPDDPARFCCSSAGFCGNTSRFCSCTGCINFQINSTYNYPGSFK